KLAESARAAMAGPGMTQQVAELKPEEENILAALAWCDHAPDGARRGLILAEGFHRFWSLLGRYALGYRTITEALRRDAVNPPSAERAWALTRASGLTINLGDYGAARAKLEESLAYWRASGEASGLPATLGGLAVVAMYQKRFADARRIGEEVLDLYQQRGQTRGVAMAFHNLGTIDFVEGRPGHGRTNLERALTLFRQSGDRATEALCLSALVTSRLRCGDREAAWLATRECLDLLEKFEAPRESVYALEAVAELLFP